MNDGYRVNKEWQIVETQTTPIRLELWEQAWPWASESESLTKVEFEIPDGSVAPLPFEFHFSDAPCLHLTAVPRVNEQKQTAQGVLKVLRAIPAGFLVRYDLTCDGATVSRTAVLEEKLVQTLKDAWLGIT